MQALDGRHARAERRRPGDERVLEVLGLLVEQREGEPGPVAEAPVQRARADARARLATSSIETASIPLSATSVPAAARIRSRLRAASARSRGCSCELRELEHHASTGAVTSRTRSARRSLKRWVSSGSLSAAVVRERVVGHADRQLGLDRVRAGRLEHLAHLGLRPDGAEQAGARADDGGRLVACSTFSGNGRDAQSSAFLSAPGSDALYSGVAISRASASSIARKNSRTGSGGVGLEVFVEGRDAREAVPLHQLDPGREQVLAARRSRRLWDPRRRLPAMPRIRMRLGLLDERELDGQRDVVGQRVATGRQRHVPVDRPTACGRSTVSSVQVRAGVAEGVGGRGDPGALGGDRAA